jgi:hypothetical protein
MAVFVVVFAFTPQFIADKLSVSTYLILGFHGYIFTSPFHSIAVKQCFFDPLALKWSSVSESFPKRIGALGELAEYRTA